MHCLTKFHRLGSHELSQNLLSKFTLLVSKTKDAKMVSNMKIKSKLSMKTPNCSRFLYGGIIKESNSVCSSRFMQPIFTRGFRMERKTKETNPNKKFNETKNTERSSKSQRQDRSENIFTAAVKSSIYTLGFSVVVFSVSSIWQKWNKTRVEDKFWKYTIDKPPAKKNGQARNVLNDVWNHLSMVHKITYGIIGLNFLVFLGWKFVNPQIMMRWFTLSIANSTNQFTSMFLSMFSHKSFIHFYINMYVLSSFCMAWNQLGHGQGNTTKSAPERYLAFYVTAGMCSSLLSLIVKLMGRVPHPSLGASGAIMGLIGYTCEKLPNNLLSIVFLPNWTFYASSAKNFIIGFDTLGLLIGVASGWRYMIFDHAGHLGGMLFGIWYAKSGDAIIDKFCNYVMQWWKK